MCMYFDRVLVKTDIFHQVAVRQSWLTECVQFLLEPPVVRRKEDGRPQTNQSFQDLRIQVTGKRAM